MHAEAIFGRLACMSGRGDQAWCDTGGSCRAIRREPRLRCALSAGWTAKQGVSVRLSSVGTRSMPWQRSRNWSGDWWRSSRICYGPPETPVMKKLRALNKLQVDDLPRRVF